MRFWYGQPDDEDDVDALFDIMYHEDCIDALPEELRRPSYYADTVQRWRNGGEHVWFLSYHGTASAVFRAELYGERTFLVHVAATKPVRGEPIMALVAAAMDQMKEHHGSVELICRVEKANRAAVSFCKLLGGSVTEEDEDTISFRRVL